MLNIEGQYWIKPVLGVICLLVGMLLAFHVFTYSFRTLQAKDKIICIFSILLIFCLGIVFTINCVPDIVTIAKQEYSESDVTVVECITKNPEPYSHSKYEKIVIYMPETDKCYEVNIVGQEPSNIKEGKIYHIKYYAAHLEKRNAKDRWVEFLYFIDDMNEEAESTE